MATEKRIKILTEAEIAELFGPPILSSNDQRFFFTLNDAELAECNRIRERDHRCMFVVLLGYFKVKPENEEWLLGLVAFAVVEEQKNEWMKHGNPPIFNRS